jgi:hypothetical protein
MQFKDSIASIPKCRWTHLLLGMCPQQKVLSIQLVIGGLTHLPLMPQPNNGDHSPPRTSAHSVSFCLSIDLKKNVKLSQTMPGTKPDMLRTFFSPLPRVCLFRRLEGRATTHLPRTSETRTMHADMMRPAATVSSCNLLLPTASF